MPTSAGAPRKAGLGLERGCALALALGLAIAAALAPAVAQAPGGAWETGDPQKGDSQKTDAQKTDQGPANTTVVPRAPSGGQTGGRAQVAVTAYLTETSPVIAQGLVWRVFRDSAGPGGKTALVSTLREASPTLRLEPGTYYINVAYGRANVTRKIAVTADQTLKDVLSEMDVRAIEKINVFRHSGNLSLDKM